MSEPAPGERSGTEIEDLHDLFENAPCGYLVLTPDGRIRKVNATFARWTGYRADALVNRSLRDLLTIAGRIFYETNFAPLIRLQGGFEEVSLDLVAADGAKLPILINALAQYGPGSALAAVRVSVVRAKERRGYERDLQGRETAAVRSLQDEVSTSELREQFIAVLGHDLRNPLASIVSGARLIRREPLSPSAVNVLRLMETSVDRMAGLINDVLDFARGRLGDGIGLNRTVSALEPVLRQVVAELEISQPGRMIACDLALQEPVSFDAGRLAQLVSNLLANALMHGDPAEPVRLTAATQEGRLEIWIANAGAAIPLAVMDRLFQPFFRGEVRASQQGLGLGLHIAAEIAKAHGGTLTVASDDTETRFTLHMPCA